MKYSEHEKHTQFGSGVHPTVCRAASMAPSVPVSGALGVIFFPRTGVLGVLLLVKLKFVLPKISCHFLAVPTIHFLWLLATRVG